MSTVRYILGFVESKSKRLVSGGAFRCMMSAGCLFLGVSTEYGQGMTVIFYLKGDQKKYMNLPTTY